MNIFLKDDDIERCFKLSTMWVRSLGGRDMLESTMHSFHGRVLS